ncbi:MAG TPA: GGDEF domain-containing protein [Candidatus Sumerlaeota bacterium]|nr:GGDEF domain-containing protein [Candidatus Sumerlaeota bacterium]
MNKKFKKMSDKPQENTEFHSEETTCPFMDFSKNADTTGVNKPRSQKEGREEISSEGARWYPLLLLIKGESVSERYLLDKEDIKIGRDPAMDISILSDDMVSRRHARIIWNNFNDPQEYPLCTIEDLGSRNGTILNRALIKNKTRLSDGDRFLIGRTVFGFYIKDDHEVNYDNKMISRARFDGLTGLSNRRTFQEDARHCIAQAIRQNNPLCLCLMDVDSFKEINDKYGHVAGDYVLRQVSRDMNLNFREGDIIGRLGGDEFAILMPQTPVAAAQSAVERFQQDIAGRPLAIQGKQININLSAGIAAINDEITKWGDLYRAADSALYEAKNSGRNRVCVFAGNMIEQDVSDVGDE